MNENGCEKLKKKKKKKTKSNCEKRTLRTAKLNVPRRAPLDPPPLPTPAMTDHTTTY